MSMDSSSRNLATEGRLRWGSYLKGGEFRKRPLLLLDKGHMMVDLDASGSDLVEGELDGS